MLFYLNLHNSTSAPLKSWNTSSIYGCIVGATVDVGLHSPEYLAALLGMRREHNILYIWHQKQLKILNGTMYAGRDAKTVVWICCPLHYCVIYNPFNLYNRLEALCGNIPLASVFTKRTYKTFLQSLYSIYILHSCTYDSKFV